MRRFPLVTLILVVLNVLVYRLELAAGGLRVCYALGLIPAQFTRTGNLSPLFSSLFLHDPEVLAHLAGNMAFLLVFGTVVEGALGHVGFAALYLTAGVLGGLAHVLISPAATEPLVGASGAIFGVLAVAVAIRPRLLGFAVLFAGINIWHAFFGGADGVSFGTHLGGFVTGSFVAMLLRLADSEALEAA